VVYRLNDIQDKLFTATVLKEMLSVGAHMHTNATTNSFFRSLTDHCRHSYMVSISCYYAISKFPTKTAVLLLSYGKLILLMNCHSLQVKMFQHAVTPATLTSTYACPEGKSRGSNNAGDIPNVLRCNYTLQLTKSKSSCTHHTAFHHLAATQMLPFQLQ